MLTINKNGYALLADMVQQQKCVSIVGQRKLTVQRPEIHGYVLAKYSKQSFAI
tara:strand:+ start:375 stop:533 length:159 start_codon:yes stop_codon:yes gene_type:complete